MASNNENINDPKENHVENVDNQSDIVQTRSSSGELYLKLTFVFYKLTFQRESRKGSYKLKVGLLPTIFQGLKQFFLMTLKFMKVNYFPPLGEFLLLILSNKVVQLTFKYP